MNIPQEYLAEKNYEGTRLIEITDPKALELRAKISAFQPEAEPHVKRIEELGAILDPEYKKIGELQEKIKEIREKMAPTKAQFDEVIGHLEKIEQKAQLIKDKLQPLVNKFMKGQLGEFERAAQLVDRDGKIYVEVIDELEEKIKAIRATKAKK